MLLKTDTMPLVERESVHCVLSKELINSGGHVPSAPPIASSSRAPAPAARARVPTGTRTASAASNAQLQTMQHALAESEEAAAGFEKERDFYFESE
jgi:hypothetical protein